MPRLFYVGALLTLAASLSAPAQTVPPLNSAPAHVEGVVVHAADKGNALTVEIQTSGAPVAPDTQAITGPDRIIIDFPGALPAAELRSLAARPLVVDQGALRGIRAGLFFKNPPITRVVLDLSEPQAYRILTNGKTIVVTLSPEKSGTAKQDLAKHDSAKQDLSKQDLAKQGLAKQSPAKQDPVVPTPATAAKARTPEAQPKPAARFVPAATIALAATPAPAATLKTTLLDPGTKIAVAKVAPAVSLLMPPPLPAVTEEPRPPQSPVFVSYVKGMLHIRAEKATLAQVLFEVQRQTQADIPIPAGAEQEEVVADIGPAPARDVLGALLNGSNYNFIFIGNEESLERVILTRRDPNQF
ncbi:MAG: AMIN domain-containing protein [Terriglobales bacterium]|jgi:hypothetical protein